MHYNSFSIHGMNRWREGGKERGRKEGERGRKEREGGRKEGREVGEEEGWKEGG